MATLLAAFANGQRPNILLIVTDDQQFNALGANGNDVLSTSTMNRIAERGVRFTQARAALPVCSPSRATIVTGQFASSHGVEDLGQTLLNDSPRLGVELREAGYSTGVTGKWHLDGPLDQEDLGFEYFATFNGNGDYYREFSELSDPDAPSKPSSQHIDAYAVERACDFIDRSVASGKPFFLWHNTQTPHLDGRLRWNALPESLARYDAKDFFDAARSVDRLPGNWDDTLQNKPPYYKGIRNYTLAQNDRRYRYGDASRLAKHTSEYYAVISELDDMLTPLMETLETTADPRSPGRALLDNTYVIFLSDNGWLMGDHAMTSKSLPFDQAVRVPLMVMGPGVDRGRTDPRQVSNLDVAPTVLNIAGVDTPPAMQGASLLSMLSDGGAGRGVREVGIVEIWETTFAGNKPILAGYDGRYEVFYTYESEAADSPSYVEVYDTRDDPWELSNVSATVASTPGAYRSVLAIHDEIQAHRVTRLGVSEHGFPEPTEEQTTRSEAGVQSIKAN